MTTMRSRVSRVVVVMGMIGGGVADARPPTSAAVDVAASCAQVVDASDVVLALRVELAALGVERVTAGGSGDVAVVVECSTSGELIVASRQDRAGAQQRAELPLADVPRDGRARVVALVVAEWLRPVQVPAADRGSATGGHGVAATGRELGPVVRVVSTSDDRLATAGAVFVLGRGTLRGEIEGAGVFGVNPNGPFVGVLGDVRAAYEPVRVGRLRVGAALGVFAAAATSQPGGDRAIAAHGEVRVRRAIGGGSWSTLVSGGGGHGLDDETGWFGMLDVAVVRGF